MKRIIATLFAVIILTSACSNSADNTIQTDDQGGISETQYVGDISSQLNTIQTIGGKLFDCFSGFDLASYNSKYNKIKAAESFTTAIETACDSILEICKSASHYKDLEYQVRLLRNLIPQPVNNTQKAIDNAAVLYKLYFQQISSSFSILSEEIEDDGTLDPTNNRIAFFEEMPLMARPDTIIYGVSFVNRKRNDDIEEYTYKSGDSPDDAQMNYNLYLIALGMDTGLTLRFSDNIVYVFLNGNMVSVLKAGTDDTIGDYFMVSFPKS